MSNDHFTRSSISTKPNIAAKQIDPVTRQRIGVSAVAGKESIASLSRHHDTSRKFIYAQKNKASSALDDAFSD